MTTTHQTTKVLAVMSFFLVALTTSAASADSDSRITAGIGSNLGVSSHSQLSGDAVTAYTHELSLRVKALSILGVELAYSPTDAHEGGNEVVFSNNLRFSGLLYFVPTPVVSAYAKAGIEGDSLGAVFSVSDASNSYHAGGGLDVEVTKNITVGIEFLMLIPGTASIEAQVQDFVDQEYARYEAALQTGEAVPEDIGEAAPELGDFISSSNYRFTIGARYYF